MQSTAENVIFSPQSAETYDLNDLTEAEIQAMATFAREHLNDDEWLTPLIPEKVVKEAIDWYAKLFIDQLIQQSHEKNGSTPLERFNLVAQDYVITHNLNGGFWFGEAFQEACLEQLQTHFSELTSLTDTTLTFEAIKVTSANGKMSYGKARVEKWLAPENVKGKHIISLDDIGDRGLTQKTIEEKAFEDGALSVITVNMVEKEVPDTVPDDEKKIAFPDVALLKIAFLYVLGWGLDDGSKGDRGWASRLLRAIAVLHQHKPEVLAHELVFQGGK